MSVSASVVLALMLFLSGRQTTQGQKPSDGTPAGKPVLAAQAQVTGGEEEYKIGPQDVLRIDVWKEPEITRCRCLMMCRPRG